jgi:hypothetical protein
MALHLARIMEAQRCPYQALDTSAMPVRDTLREEARDGWPATPTSGSPTDNGLVRGLPLARCGQPHWRDHRLRPRRCFHQRPAVGLKTFFALRREPNPRAPSVGSAAAGPYLTDKGIEGQENYRRWLECYGARVVCPPRRNGRKRRWPKRLRRWVASSRQIVETVYEKLHNAFDLRRERAHELQGLRARLAARVALHNLCIQLNEQLGRPRLAFAELLGR